MKKFSFLLFALAFIMSGCDTGNSDKAQKFLINFRPPAYPLVSVDPYFSIWAFQDTLYNGPTRHWTGKVQSLQGFIRVDGKTMRFLGQPIPQYQTVLPLAGNSGTWEYTTSIPDDGWQQPDFDASSWQTAKGAFSDRSTGSSKWTSRDIWARRTFNLQNINFDDLLLSIQHDDGVTVFLNGVKAFEEKGATGLKKAEISGQAKKTLQSGENILAVHCVNTGGLAYLDAGLVNKKKPAVQLPTVHQTSVEVTATETTYHFKAGPVNLQVTFTAPKLPNNLKAFSRPADYVTFKVHSNDGQAHQVQLYFSAAGNLAVNTPNQNVIWKEVPAKGLSVMRVGTASQNILGRKGDDVRIDWGYFYLASPKNDHVTSAMDASVKSIKNFAKNGSLTLENDENMPRAAEDHPITLATAYNFEKVGEDSENYHVILAYDQLYPIEYFHDRLKAWWKRSPNMTTVKMLEQRAKNYKKLMKQSNRFDAKLAQKAIEAGGEKYAKLCELAYRQSVAACKLVVGPKGKPLFLSKENFSNGSIGTVDIMYPTSPLLLYYNPDLLKGMLRPIFYYVESGQWTKPFAPHDVGTYPIANGQTYGGDMPVEESGNMLIATAAIAEVEGDASFAKKHWKTLTQWADYLLQFGMDPKYQLTTDDFAGRTAHNANLSLKAIMGIASYGKMADMLGKKKLATTYVDTARSMAKKWIKKAKEDDHYKLTFTRDSSWSQKYNLVWDKVFDWDIFPDKVARNAIAFYLTKQNKYGLPLDSRATYTKSDWINWTATLASDKATFKKLIAPLYKAYDETKDRVPMSDWYQTTDASQVGFQARSVVGGFFMKMLQVRMDNRR